MSLFSCVGVASTCVYPVSRKAQVVHFWAYLADLLYYLTPTFFVKFVRLHKHPFGLLGSNLAYEHSLLAAMGVDLVMQLS
jgi:hypothetical protein